MDTLLIRPADTNSFPPPHAPTLILHYDTMWGMFTPESVPMPAGFEVTTDRRRYVQAHAVIFHIPQWKWQPRFLFPKKLPGQIWVALSMECETNYPRLQDPAFMRKFDVTMTYRYDSDIPVPYFSYFSSAAEFLQALRQPSAPKTARVPAVAFISSRFNASGRRAYVRKLMRYLPTDSYGKFLNNAQLGEDHGRPSKLKALAPYKFNLAFENAIAHDYITEKFFDPLLVGSVPVYLGAPNADEHAPGDHCFINVHHFANPRALADYLHHLLHDDAAYNAYFAWKDKPFRPLFVSRVHRGFIHSVVRLCEWLQAHP